MPEVVRAFNEAGLAEFARWLRAGALGAVPEGLIEDAAFSTPWPQARVGEVPAFKHRYALGEFLVALLAPYDPHQIAYDGGLWSWLAALLFEQLAPADAHGKRILRRPYVYVLSESRVYYRHLVRTPWYLVRIHGAEARYLLMPMRDAEPAPLSSQSALLNELAARQFIISSPTLIGAARRLYTDPRSGRLRRGAGGHGKGSPRRLARIANQLALTYDIHNMSVDQFMRILPREFR
ncbi:MAG: hypothetical protein ACJ8F3_14275 [Xanthobacteraceae bacterium]